MLALVAALADEFGEAKLFRPNRDIRFSGDKSPYKTHQGAFAATPGGAGYYDRSARRSQGRWRIPGARPGADRPPSRRRRCRSPGTELEALLESLRRKRFEVVGEKVKTTPRGYAADHPRIETLRHKELMAVRDFGDPGWLWHQAGPCRACVTPGGRSARSTNGSGRTWVRHRPPCR